MKRAIEESFPIVEINRLAVPERNAFKPIYQMHKWFARRASCVFRAILLASMKPADTDIMEEFYKDHTDDPDTNGVKILDPFMGGGTTVVEALRLGCHVTGIDLNPVAWFIVRTEVEPVDIDKLKDAFKRLEERTTHAGKTVKEELLSHYKTECPCCGASRKDGNKIPLNKGGQGVVSDNSGAKKDADIIYTFWVKSAICTNPNCKQEVTLFNNYIIAQKSPTIRYLADYEYTHCKKMFDMDIEPASLIAEKALTVYNPKDASGELRSHKRWALWDSMTNRALCPWCSNENLEAEAKLLKKAKKKVPLAVLLCPHCFSVWQYRGTLPEDISCPACKKDYSPNKGNVIAKGSFVCQQCGSKDKIINSIRKLPQEQLLPTRPYAIEGYCPACAGEGDKKDLFNNTVKTKKLAHSCMINKNNGKFFKRITPSDLKRYQGAEKRWEKEKEMLPYPKQMVPVGEKTKSGLIAHHYIYWHQMFNPRQLLCLSTLLKAIGEEDDQVMKEMLLTAFYQILRNQNMFCFHNPARHELEPLFSRHDFAPVNTALENNVWGNEYGRGNFISVIDKVIKGKQYAIKPYDSGQIPEMHKDYRDPIHGEFSLYSQSSTANIDATNVDLIITDPPYAGNVNYSELSDFFFVWLRLALSNTYPMFAPEVTPKAEEIIENPTRGKSADDFKEGLKNVFTNCYKVLKDEGLMAFTFHHAEGSAWESVLTAICDAGFEIGAVYPIHGDAIKGGAMGAMLISYDLIHVCKKRRSNDNTKKRSWAGVRQEIRMRARQEIAMIEAGRYGSEKLLPADINIILIGKCLELYSKHYGAIVDHNGDVVPLQKALASIRMMVEQLIDTAHPLPSELEHIDPISYVYLTCLCDRKEIQSDEVHKATRGILEIDALMKAGVMRKGRAKRGRTYEVKQPDERYKDLQVLFKKDTKNFHQLRLFPEMEEERFDNVALVDIIHYLMELANASENLMLWLNEFKQAVPQVRVALEYLKIRNPTFQAPIQKILSLIEV